MNRVVTRIGLAGSGAILGLIGGALMLAPKAFLEMSHVFVEGEPSLMSELTAPSGVLLIASALMILGAVRLRFANLALSAGAIVYGGYGVGRLVSMAIHGLPSASLVTATVIEFGVAAMLVALRLMAASSTKQRAIPDTCLAKMA